MKSNKGFTLVELIVVVAIIGIIIGAMTYSINSVSSTRAKKVASDLSALISQCRVDTLSGAPSPTYLEISKDGKVYYGILHEGGEEKARQKLGGSGVSISWSSQTEGDALKIGFSRATGAMDVINYQNCTSITVISGAGSYTITLVPKTGYHSVGR
jgi:prepilin-type N-terminal cleavage/methylation domain-containing protein